jgi:hypothetical protein
MMEGIGRPCSRFSNMTMGWMQARSGETGQTADGFVNMVGADAV